jgi:hypothetical protein
MHPSYPRRVSAIGALLFLSACSTAGSTQLQINEGFVSAMNQSNTDERNQIHIIQNSLPREPRYAPLSGCTYHRIHSPLSAPMIMSQFTLTVRPVRDQFLITFNDPQGTGTALISANGQVRDFNMVDLTTGIRVTSDNYRGPDPAAGKPEAASGGRTDTVNPISVMFPEFVNADLTPGSDVAYVFTPEGAIWASYVHRGLTSYDGRDAAVFDLVRTSGGRGTRRTIGFSVVDLATMSPLLLVVDTGYVFRLERLSCP